MNLYLRILNDSLSLNTNSKKIRIETITISSGAAGGFIFKYHFQENKD